MPRLLERTYRNDVTFFDSCPQSAQPSDPEDLTLLFKAHPDLRYSCIYNPSVVQLDDESDGLLMLVSYRIFTPAEEGAECIEADRPGGQWYLSWQGHGGLGLAVRK